MSRQLNFGRRLGLLHRLIANESRFRRRHSFSALPARSGVGRIFRFAVRTAHVHSRGLIKFPAGAKSSALEKFVRCLGLSDSYLSLFAAFCGIFSSDVSFRVSGRALRLNAPRFLDRHWVAMKSSISALEYVAGESMTSSNFQPILSRTDRGPNRWTR